MNRLGLLAVVLVLGFCGTAGASWHRVHLMAHPGSQTWRAPKVPADALSIDLRIYRDGRRVRDGVEDCAAWFAGRGIAGYSPCGTPVRLHYSGVGRFTLLYRFR